MHIVVGLKRTWGQKLSSGRLMSGHMSSALTVLMSLTFMTVHLFLFSFEDRRVRTGAVPGQIALNEWCLVVRVQTAVEVAWFLRCRRIFPL